VTSEFSDLFLSQMGQNAVSGRLPSPGQVTPDRVSGLHRAIPPLFQENDAAPQVTFDFRTWSPDGTRPNAKNIAKAPTPRDSAARVATPVTLSRGHPLPRSFVPSGNIASIARRVPVRCFSSRESRQSYDRTTPSRKGFLKITSCDSQLCFR
jgi:hypothetical protein